MTPQAEPPDEVAERWLHNAAVSVTRTWPDVLVEDVKQELYIKWLEKFRYIKKYLDDPDEEKGRKYILRCLMGWGHDYAKRETAAIRQCSPDDLHPYGKAAIRMLLPILFDPESWTSFAAKGGDGTGGRSNRPVNEGGDVMAVYADLRRAWDQLEPEQVHLLMARYVNENEECYADLAASYGTSEVNMRKRVERALSALQKHMQGTSRYEAEKRRRAAQSNAAAQAQTRRNWNGE